MLRCKGSKDKMRDDYYTRGDTCALLFLNNNMFFNEAMPTMQRSNSERTPLSARANSLSSVMEPELGRGPNMKYFMVLHRHTNSV